MDLSHTLSIWILTISSPWALFEQASGNIFNISIEKSIFVSDLSVIKGESDGNVPSLSINEYCFAKKELKSLLFPLKSVISLLSWKNL